MTRKIETESRITQNDLKNMMVKYMSLIKDEMKEELLNIDTAKKQNYLNGKEQDPNKIKMSFNYFFARANPKPNNPPKTSIAPPAIAASFLNSLLISFSIYSCEKIHLCLIRLKSKMTH